jgi:NADPH:quinone reductase-like Zn-dependent oxidoreductase
MNTEAMVLVKNGAAQHAFERRTISLSEPTLDQVVIESEAFGLNYADVLARKGMYREAPPLPSILGYEVVGRIIKIGKNVDPDLQGKRVSAICRFGCYARHVIAFDSAVIEIGELTPAEEAMSLCTQAVSAYYMAEYIAPIHKGDRVLIHASGGGVGTNLIQLAKRKGAEVFAKIGDASKAELVKSLGADHVINYNESDYVKQVRKILDGNRLSTIYNPISGSTFKKDLTLLSAGGKLFLYGIAELSTAKWGVFSELNFLRKVGLLLPVRLMVQSKSILGVNMLKIADNCPEILANCMENVLKLYNAGVLKPKIGGKYHVNDLHIAHFDFESRKTTGKLTVFWEDKRM